ncbi:MAG: hypothetical protein R6V46_18675 [Desulfatiglandaceae bacterium]|jgi:uncharacterized membrane protein (DUF373 family)
MGKVEIFALRLILSILFAVLISRFFFQNMEMVKIIGLGVVLFGLAYLLEYLRKRDKGERHEN